MPSLGEAQDTPPDVPDLRIRRFPPVHDQLHGLFGRVAERDQNG